MYALIHDTFEATQKSPVVRHVFVGDTKKKAKGFFRAHMKTDSFMRQCTNKGNFDGKFACSTKQRMTSVSPKQLAALQTQELAGAVHGLGDVGACPPPSFWRFASTLAIGQLAALGTGWLIRSSMKDAHPRTSGTVTVVGSLAAFWLASGLSWAAMGRKKPDVRLDRETMHKVSVPTAPRSVPNAL